jgi:CMP-N-acetylneuraminic acid synthetase
VIGPRSVLAVVPARSGSKGIPGKNLRPLRGTSLIGWAGLALEGCDFVDRRILSTDSEEYAAEGRRYGLDTPFLRPAELSTDDAEAVPTVQHALRAVEAADGRRYDVILIVEPTSPLRRPEDLARCARRLVEERADAVVTVSPLDPKAHPRKLLALDAGRLSFLDPAGADVKRRQQLGPLYWRNGVCYAVSRDCLVERGVLFGPVTLADVIERPVVNIDSLLDLEWAEFLLARQPSR